jgi:hypothetical protein
MGRRLEMARERLRQAIPPQPEHDGPDDAPSHERPPA